MGIFLSTVEKDIDSSASTDNQLVGLPLLRIKQYHGTFKAVCQNFTIHHDNIRQIFPDISDHTYKMWDRQNNNFVDALQLFAGMAIFALNCSFEEKAKFLFDLVDFNELNSISNIDLEYLIICVCNSVFKVMNKFAQVNDQEIASFVEKYFDTAHRISLPQVLRWCSTCDQVRTLMRLIKRDGPKAVAMVKKKTQFKESKRFQSLMSKKVFAPQVQKQAQLSLQFPHIQQWTMSISKKIIHPQIARSKQHSVEISWVYGIRCQDIKHPLLCITVQGLEGLIYYVAKLGIIYIPDLNIQRFYNNHFEEIISMDATNDGLAASGEFADSPSIHIWSYRTCRTNSIIKGAHRNGIHLLKFILNGKLLASAGLKTCSPILVHSVQTVELLYSTELREIAVQLFTIDLLVQEYVSPPSQEISFFKPVHNCFLVCGLKQIWIFQNLNKKFFRKRIEVSDQKASISSAVAIKLNGINPYLRCFSNPRHESVVLLVGYQGGELFKWPLMPQEQPNMLHKYDQGISQLKVFRQNSSLAVVYGSVIEIHGMSLALGQFRPIRKISIDQFLFKSMEKTISDLVCTKQALLIVITSGEVLKLNLGQTFVSQQSSFAERLQVSKLAQITNMLDVNLGMSLFGKNNFSDKLFFVAAGDGTIRCYSSKNRQIIDVWSLPQHITAIDCKSIQEGGIVFAAGSSNGKLYIRIDWQQNPRSYDCGSRITTVKITNDVTFMVAGCVQEKLFFFIFNNGSFFSSPPKRIQFDDIPLECQFLDDNRSFLVSTSSKSHYQIQIPELKFKNVMQENQKISCSIWELKYPLLKNKKQLALALPIVIAPDKGIYLAAGNQGSIYFWGNRQDIQNGSVNILRGHASECAKIVLTDQRDIFYSLGSKDGCLIEWKLKQVKSQHTLKSSYFQSSSSHSQELQPDEFILKEFQFCRCKESFQDLLKDQFVLIKGNQKKIPSQLVFGDMWKRDPFSRMAPFMSLKLDYVYGYSGSQKRHSVGYVGQQERMIASHTSRILVLENPQTKRQSYFQTHKYKISCIAIHPNRVLVASGEAAPHPKIFITNVLTKRQRILKSAHRKGINSIAFSYQDNLLASYGFHQEGCCLEITNWFFQEILIVKQEVLYSILHMAFNPTRSDILVTCGILNVNIFKINGRILEKISRFQLADSLFFVAPMKFKFDKVFCGGKAGNLYAVTSNKLVVGRQQAHKGTITCGKIIQFNNEVLLITGGQDGVVRIWSTAFQLLNEFKLLDLQQIRSDVQTDEVLLSTVSSLDVMQLKKKLYYLVGTTDCHIVQFKAKYFDKKRSNVFQDSFENRSFSRSAQLNYQIQTNIALVYHQSYFSSTASHSSSKRLLFCVNPKTEVFATTSDNGFVIITDFEDNQVVTKINPKSSSPSAMIFTPEGTMLVLGYMTGEFHVYEFDLQFRSRLGSKHILKLVQVNRQPKKQAIVQFCFYWKQGLMAVSHNSCFQGDRPKTNSFVSIYQNKSKKMDLEKNLFIQLFNIPVDGKISVFRADQHFYSPAVTHMQFIQQASTLLIMFIGLVDDQCQKSNMDLLSQCIIWNVTQNTIAKQVKIDRLSEISLPPHYLYIRTQFVNQYATFDRPIESTVSTSMVSLGESFILGTSQGQIIFVKSNSIQPSEVLQLKKDNMCLGKTYLAHVSAIDDLAIDSKCQFLLTSGITDQCIFRWRLILQSQNDQDFNSSIMQNDPINQVFPKHSFINKINNVLAVRSEVIERSKIFQPADPNNSHLKLYRIIGRRAIDRRNNVHYDVFHRWVYSSGCNVVLSKDNSQFSDLQEFNQQFFLADDTENSSGPQISCISLSKDRRLMIAGTCQNEAVLLIWNICSHIRLKRIRLRRIHQVLFSKFSNDNTHVCAYGVTEDYSGAVILAEVQSQQVIGFCNFLLSPPWRIKDIDFINNSNHELLTVGVNHIAAWHYKGHNLTYRNIKQEQENQQFNTLVIYNNFVFISTEEGLLIMLDQKLNLHRVERILKSAVRSLAIRNNILAAGSVEGDINIYKLNEQNIKLLRQCKLSQALINEEVINFGIKEPMELEIQSLSIDQKFILVGTKLGDIYEIGLQLPRQSSIFKRLSHHDHDVVECLCFSSRGMFSLTRCGQLQFWELGSFRLLRKYKFKRETRHMIAIQSSPVVLIAFQNQVQVLCVQQDKYNFLSQLQLRFKEGISACAVSPDESVLIVATVAKDDVTAKIHIYRASWNASLSHKLTNTVEGISNTVEMLDFSSDNKLMLYKDRYEDVSIIELNSGKKISTLFVQNQIEWVEDGIRTSQKVRGIQRNYNNENRITKMRLLSENTMAVADQMGTILLFDYPCDGIQTGNTYFGFYQNHLNYINCMQVCKHKKFMASASEVDRSILIWRIVSKE